MQVSVVVGVHPQASLTDGENHTFSVAMSIGARQLMLASGIVSVDTSTSSLGVSRHFPKLLDVFNMEKLIGLGYFRLNF